MIIYIIGYSSGTGEEIAGGDRELKREVDLISIRVSDLSDLIEKYDCIGWRHPNVTIVTKADDEKRAIK